MKNVLLRIEVAFHAMFNEQNKTTGLSPRLSGQKTTTQLAGPLLSQKLIHQRSLKRIVNEILLLLLLCASLNSHKAGQEQEKHSSKHSLNGH